MQTDWGFSGLFSGTDWQNQAVLGTFRAMSSQNQENISINSKSLDTLEGFCEVGSMGFFPGKGGGG